MNNTTIKIYNDKSLTQEVDNKTLDFGIVTAGDKGEYTFYAHNDTRAELRNIVFSVEHKEVKIIAAPTAMAPGDIQELVMEWKPSVTLKEGLKTQLYIKGEELWRG